MEVPVNDRAASRSEDPAGGWASGSRRRGGPRPAAGRRRFEGDVGNSGQTTIVATAGSWQRR